MDAITTTPTPIHYPESDGKPMGETDVHIDALIYLREALRDYFRDDPQMYVAGNMLLYYEEGNPAACVAPDVFVVQGVTKQERRIYRLWAEGQPPAVVFEITSRGSRLEDLGTKRAVYAMLGVREYFVYDPLGEYLRPPLQGYQLQEGEYQRLPPGVRGRWSAKPWAWSCGWRRAACAWLTPPPASACSPQPKCTRLGVPRPLPGAQPRPSWRACGLNWRACGVRREPPPRPFVTPQPSCPRSKGNI
jgi:Uma2 family endonuclease